MFTGESSLEHAEIDVNDPDFWKKVLPDLVTPDIMFERLTDDSLCEDDVSTATSVSLSLSLSLALSSWLSLSSTYSLSVTLFFSLSVCLFFPRALYKCLSPFSSLPPSMCQFIYLPI